MLSSVRNFNHARIGRRLEKAVGHDFSAVLILLDPRLVNGPSRAGFRPVDGPPTGFRAGF